MRTRKQRDPIQVARDKGALAGILDRELWNYSKRELLEAALHLAWQASGRYGNNPRDAESVLKAELKALKYNGKI